jgi:hypothetical protein
MSPMGGKKSFAPDRQADTASSGAPATAQEPPVYFPFVYFSPKKSPGFQAGLASASVSSRVIS